MYRSCWTHVLVVLVLGLVHLNSADDQQRPGYDSKLLRKILRDYNSLTPPSTNSSTEVKLGLVMENLQPLENGIIRWNIAISQSWEDPRLEFTADGISYLYLSPSTIRSLWLPDTYFPNTLKALAVIHGMTQNTKVFLYPNGTVLFTQRMQLDTECIPLKKTLRSECSLILESFKYTINELEYEWMTDPAIEFAEGDAGLESKGYSLDSSQTTYCSNSRPCLMLEVTLHSSLAEGHGISYAVGILLVLVSWISFWVDGDKVAERAGLLLGILITLAVLRNGAGVTSSGVDTVMGGCMLFVVAAMLEYALAYCLLQWIPTKLSKKAAGDPSPCAPASRLMDIICGLVIFPVALVIFLITIGAVKH